MKVLFVYKYLTLGGVETVLRARLDRLNEHGIEARAWFFHDLGGRSVFAGAEERLAVGDVSACLERLAGGGFDLVSSIDTEEIFPGLAALGRRGPRLVAECHSPYLENVEYLRSLAAYRPAAVLVPSEHQRRVVRERVGAGLAVRVVPNPLRQAFVDEPSPFPAPPPRPVVAWIGRLDSLKNWRGFVDLGGALWRRGVEVEFWIAGRGSGPETAADLARRTRQAGMLQRLRWYRGLPHERVPAFLDAVRDSGGVAVSTSRGESFGMTVAEAMARRCAVAVPAEPPFTELVEHGRTGFCYAYPEEGIWDQAAAGIEGLLADAARRRDYGTAARSSILARFAPDVAVAALAAELRRLAAA